MSSHTSVAAQQLEGVCERRDDHEVEDACGRVTDSDDLFVAFSILFIASPAKKTPRMKTVSAMFRAKFCSLYLRIGIHSACVEAINRWRQ